MNYCRGAHELVNLRIALPPKIRNISLRLLDRASHPARDVATHITDSLQAPHLVPDCRCAGKEIRLMRAEALGVEGEDLGEGRELGGELLVDVGVETEEFWVWGPGGRGRDGRWGCGVGGELGFGRFFV